MKALIDIKTESGKSLEGMPKTIDTDLGCAISLTDRFIMADAVCNNPVSDIKLHPGDTITIKIERE